MALRKPNTDMSEREMFLEYRRTGDKKLRNEIIEAYIYIAEILSRRFVNRGIEYEDIYQVACMGVIKAVDRFDPDREVKFATFATPTVLGEIRKYFRDKGSFIKIPRRLYEVFCKAEQIRRANAGNEENTSVKDIARALNIPEELVREAQSLADSSLIQSLDREAYADGKLSVSNVLGFEDKNFLIVENKGFMDYVMSVLSDTEKRFIYLRYEEEKTQREIAQILDVSQMQVSRMEKKILKKLRDLYFRD